MNFRQMCYQCHRPAKLCLCKYIVPVDTHTKFIILIHPKEYKRIKNNTGRLTHLSLPNSELFTGVDFTHHNQLNAILDNPANACYILYPGTNSTPLHEVQLPERDRQLVIILIDATWSSAKPMLRLSKNLHSLPKISFTHTKTSAYRFKRQPFCEALSTMESTHCVLEILQQKAYENIPVEKVAHFLDPFHEMVKYQVIFKG